jgi:pimeloyl-ACP methyl ester carboxylesterase
MHRYLYLHGFGTNHLSRKGVYLHDELAADGIDLELLDLNVPSFERQTYSAILGSIDERVAAGSEKLRLLGSSMGGYLAARWAELNPERVDRLFLLCPGFDLISRWPVLLGPDQMQRWEAEGTLDVENAAGLSRPLHWGFIEDSRRHPRFPEVPCPTRILHGTSDPIVPIDGSRRYAGERPHVGLIETDDEHPLERSMERIASEVRIFFEIGRA